MKAAQHSIIASLIGLSFLGFTTTSFAQQDYYKWVDSHGSTHYTTTPPPKAKGVKTRGKVQTYGWATTPAPATTNTNNNNTSQKNTSQPTTNHASSTQNQSVPVNNQENLPASAPKAQ